MTSSVKTGLQANTEYCFTATAQNGPFYESARSNVACAKTLPTQAPPPPTSGAIFGTLTIDSVTPNCGTVSYKLDSGVWFAIGGTSTLGNAPGLFRCNYSASYPIQSVGAHNLCVLNQAIITCKPAPVAAGQTTIVSF